MTRRQHLGHAQPAQLEHDGIDEAPGPDEINEVAIGLEQVRAQREDALERIAVRGGRGKRKPAHGADDSLAGTAPAEPAPPPPLAFGSLRASLALREAQCLPNERGKVQSRGPGGDR
jgi:hypothetical protein